MNKQYESIILSKFYYLIGDISNEISNGALIHIVYSI